MIGGSSFPGVRPKSREDLGAAIQMSRKSYAVQRAIGLRLLALIPSTIKPRTRECHQFLFDNIRPVLERWNAEVEASDEPEELLAVNYYRDQLKRDDRVGDLARAGITAGLEEMQAPE